MRRSVLAVLAGFVAVVILSTGTDAVLHAFGVFPADPQAMGSGLFGLAIAYRAAFTVAGGAVTGWLSPRADLRDVYILAGIGVAAGLAGVAAWFATPDLGPLWYALLIPVTGPPSAVLGGWLIHRTP